jgi:hypothetical protein
MSPVDLFPLGPRDGCWINTSGLINFGQDVMDAFGWQVGDTIAVQYIERPLTLLLWHEEDPARRSFKLSYLSRNQEGTSGGKLSMRAFTRRILTPRVQVPLENLKPVRLNGNPYEMGLLLEAPTWQEDSFSLAGVQRVPGDCVGVYDILGPQREVLRIGEGLVRQRLGAHLKHESLAAVGRWLRYMPLDADDSAVLEKILLGLYEADHGQLPPFNAIRA